jgi:PAS domain S-box-containing protein
MIGLVGNVFLGLFVLLSNPKRSANVGFFILSVLAVLWLGSMFFCSIRHTEIMLLFWIRQTSAFAGLMPFGFFILQLLIANPDITLTQCFYRLRYWVLACFSMVVLCHSSVFVLYAKNPTEIELVPYTKYGWGYSVYVAFYILVIVMLMTGVSKASKSSIGAQKEGLQFLQMGFGFGLITGVVFYVCAELFNNQEISLFVPLSALVLDGFVAYGIATKRILAVSEVLQRVTAYILMTLYLVGVYIFSAWIGRSVICWFVVDPTYLSYLVAALVTAFSVVPAHGWMHIFSQQLFSSNLLNVNEILERAGHVFREMSTEEKLMESFSDLIAKTFVTAQIVMLRSVEGNKCIQCFPVSDSRDAISLKSGSAIVRLLMNDREPFTIDTLHRMRPTKLVTEALDEMQSIGVAVVLGSFAHQELKSVLMLYPKNSGRIYDLREQRALQLLCDQLAVALENANLYTAVQNGKIYNDILLDSLTSGIVAVNSDRQVTVFNQRAQSLTGLTESSVVDQSMDVLPPALIEGLEIILNTQAGFRDKDMSIPLGGEDVPVRVSGSMFRGHTGNLLGALVVFNDMTVLKKMEEQIRRTDRLSSIGTLSAGMAHEIKNPLVTIKTFTQLLPQQYADTDFRRTFFDLVGQEVKRIDTIVNRLLNFARPAQASLKPVSLHEIIENSLRLAEQQFLQHEITLNRQLNAPRHIIEADAEQLNQTFINFFLNATHAMRNGGTLTVRTSIIRPSHDFPLVAGLQNGDSIRVDVQDTGCGIAPEDLSKIFDPFFTTKEDGVGLGLSVSHGIIHEHGGIIDVESEKGKGTVFHVQFPLLKTQEKKEE